MLRASIALLLHALTGLALPGAESSMDKRQDPDDIMMFVCDNYQGRSLSELCTGMCFGSFCAGNGQSLVYDKPSPSDARARARQAGCRPTPNRCSQPPYGSDFECDEFPFKSVKDTNGGTRVNRCVPKQQNQDQSQIIKAFYTGFCKDKNPCSFNTGYENSGGIKYCANDGKCDNDGNEYTKGGQYQKPSRSLHALGRDGHLQDIEFRATYVNKTRYPTHFETADGTKVRVPAGARVGQRATRLVITNMTAWDEHINELIAAEEGMTEDQYWQHKVAPASDALMSLVRLETTSITRELSD